MLRKAAVLALALISCLPVLQAQKKRVAVMNFDYAAVTTNVTQLFGTNQDIGKGIADMIVDRLVNSGAYSVIERKELDKIIAEQNFSNSDRADPASAAKIARILGVEAIIIGSITQFGRDDKKTNIGAGLSTLGRFGIGGASHSNATAVVQLTSRMIDTSTAEILATAAGNGTASRSGTGILGSGGNWDGAGGGGLDMRSSNFGATILGEATNKAVDEISKQLVSKAASLPTVTIEVSGLVADAEPDGTVIINVGSKGGVKKGETLAIKRKIKDINDPATGKVLRSIEDTVGTMTVTEVEEDSATGKFKGAGKPQTGDRVSSKQ